MGSRTKVVRANSVTSSYDYDALNRLTGVAHRPSSNATALLSGFRYALHADGKRGAVHEEVYNAPGSSIASWRWLRVKQ